MEANNIIINSQITEMVKDYREVQDAYTKAEKQVFAEKYGVDSNKAKEIAQAIILKANDIRKKRSSYVDEDWMVWNLAFDCPSSRKKIEEALVGEHENFIQFCIEKTMKPSWRGDKRNVIFRTIQQERKKSADPLLPAIKARLLSETKAFKAQFISSIFDHEVYRFEYYEKYKDLKLVQKYNVTTHRYEYVVSEKNTCEVPENLSDKWIRSFNTMKVLSNNFDRKFFEARVIKNAEDLYNNTINSLAEKLFKQRVNASLLKVNYITDDPKLFEMLVSDGTETFYCRSIFCAEYSHLVESHWRFIITKRSK